MHKIRFYRHLQLKYFLGGGGGDRPHKGRGNPLSSFPPLVPLTLRERQWPYHFSKLDVGTACSDEIQTFKVFKERPFEEGGGRLFWSWIFFRLKLNPD